MIERIHVIGSGRVGSAVAARLGERGIAVRVGRVVEGDPQLVLLCVPDTAIADVARGLTPGPLVGHVSGATSLAALDPHERRFSIHPLQTFTRSRGPEQLDGAWGAITADDEAGHERALWLAETLGLRPFVLADDRRALYHAGAAVASNYLVTLYRAAAELFERAGAPPAALVPLMERTIENGFELTGPVARGDWETVDRHRSALAGSPVAALYDTLAEATAP